MVCISGSCSKMSGRIQVNGPFSDIKEREVSSGIGMHVAQLCC
jgi:hypothetical protein